MTFRLSVKACIMRMKPVDRKSTLIGFFFSLTVALYLYIVSTHRISGPVELYKAIQVMTYPLVPDSEGQNRCRKIDEKYYRCLPNVFLIGASKAGTTSVANFLLNKIDGVSFVNRRITKRDKHMEVHRFDRNTYPYSFQFLEMGTEWASAPLVTDVDEIVIHYTPHYLYAPTVPLDMRTFYAPYMDPSTLRFLVMLRNPIDRALSSYWFSQSHLFPQKGKGNGSGSGKGKGKSCTDGEYKDCGSIEEFEDQIDQQIKLKRSIEMCLDMKGQNPALVPYDVAGVYKKTDRYPLPQSLETCYGSLIRSPRLGDLHLDKSVYVDQLHRWFVYFPPGKRKGSQSQQKEKNGNYWIGTLEQLSKDPQALYNRLLKFLDRENSNADYLGQSNKIKEIKEKTVVYRGYKTYIVDSVDSSGGNGGSAISEEDIKDMKVAYLSKPNALQDLEVNKPHTQLIQKLENFYQPYEERLGKLLEAVDAKAD